MIKIILILFSGILLGYILRNKNLTIIHKLITFFIWALLFSLGISVGMNETLLTNLPTLGLDAFIITIGGLAGSLVMAWIIYIRFFKADN